MGELSAFLIKNDDNFRRARLPALYSDFQSQNSLNPDAYQTNIRTWRKGIARAAWKGILLHDGHPDLLSISVDDRLLSSLENREFGRPLSIGAVVTESIRNGTLIPLEEFLTSSQSIYARSLSRVVWDVISWATRLVGLGSAGDGGNGKAVRGRFVAIENVEAAGGILALALNREGSPFDSLFTRKHFEQSFRSVLGDDGPRVSTTDFDVLLKFMSRDKGVIAYDGHTVKVRAPGSSATITQEDEAIASLKGLIASLELHLGDLTLRRAEHDRNARISASNNNLVVAKGCLRSRKMVDSALETCFSTLHRLQQVANSIQQASDQVQLVKAVESSTGVLKSLNAEVGGVDNVARLMNRLEDHISDTKEVGRILAEGVGDAIPDDEIDAELELLESEVVRDGQAEMEHRLAGLKSPPVSEPRPTEKEGREAQDHGVLAASMVPLPN